MSKVFRPVHCTEKKLFSETAPITPIDGYLYFATDTKKIYLGKDDKFLPMGGNSGIYYGRRTPADGEADLEDTEFSFIISEEIEGTNTPNADDLILNIPDGCFYRVLSVDSASDLLIGEKLTVAGSGGGSGSGGSTTTSSKPVINNLNNNSSYFSVNDEKIAITFSCSSQTPENNYIDIVEYTIANQTFTDEKSYQFGEDITIDLTQHLGLLSTQTVNTISILVQDVYGSRSYKKTFSFYILDLELTSSANEIISVKSGNSYNYTFTPYGGAGSSSALTRYVELKLAPLDNSSNTIWSTERSVSSTGSALTVNIPFYEIDNIEHGVYILTARYCAFIESSNTLVYSNTLTHQVAYIDVENVEPLIATSFVEQTIQQYTKYNMSYMVACGSDNSEIEVVITVAGNAITETAKLNEVSTWSYTFTDTGIYPIAIEYNGKTVKLGELIVEQYSSEDIPTIDTSIVEFYLSPLGKSNSQSNKDEWISNYGGKSYAASFENFLWGSENGWIEDEEGPNLKLTNGAKLTIPDYRPFATDGVNGLTIEIDFKLSNISDYQKPLIECLSCNYTNGVVSSINAGFQVTGEKATLNSKNYNASLEQLGENSTALSSFIQYFGEDTRIHLAYVIDNLYDKTSNYHFVYTYVNGVLSAIMEMPSNEAFKDTDTSPAVMIFDSTYGDINLYGIRVYRTPITTSMAINNYIADIYDVDTKIALAKNNRVYNSGNKVSKSVIDNLSSTLGVKYCVFEGGFSMPKSYKGKYTFKNVSSSGYETAELQLPQAKTDYRFMSMAMYEKKEGEEVKTIFSIPMILNDGNEDITISNPNDIKSNTSYSFVRGVQTYGQGTSSMVYPVKNLRVKYMQKEDYQTPFEGGEPVQIVCLKADYMDSSSTHNTCTGNLVYDLYDALGMRTPPQAFDDKYGAEYDIVTAIKGFPIICFYKDYQDTDKNDDYIYIGRYNFNLDKANPESFGFPPKYHDTGKTTMDDEGRERRIVESCGYRVEEVNGYTVFPLDEKDNEVLTDIVQCWEFLNNDAGSPTKFLTPYKAGTEEKYVSYNAALNDAWDAYYEDRYPDEYCGAKEENTLTDEMQQAIENGLFRMSSWVNSTSKDEASNEELPTPVLYKTLDEEPTEGIAYYNASGDRVDLITQDYISVDVNYSEEESGGLSSSNVSVNLETFKGAVSGYGRYIFSFEDGLWSAATEDGDTIAEIAILADYGISLSKDAPEGQSIIIELYNTYSNWTPESLYELHEYDNARYRIAKFYNEFEDYFDMDFSLFYYVLTLVLLMMDSRAKNMMMASWDMKIWYPIFYDMDTILGLNNTGINKFSYDTEDDPEDMVFNGYDSVLWNNFREVFPNEIATFYNKLRGSMTLKKLLNTYNTEGADAFNEALTSEDAIYKYERPYTEGYYDGANGKDVAAGAINYLYAAQGRRSHHRTWWLSNRLDYFDSKEKPLSYGTSEKPSQSEAFSFRAYALPEQKSSESTEACIAAVPANHKFKLTALTNSYQSIFIGNIVYGPVYAAAGETVEVGPASPKHEVESYILNPTLISDLGDLSDKYIGSWQMPNNKLVNLRFGQSSRSHPETYDKYYNSLLTTLSLGTAASGANTPFLKYLNVARCTGLKTLNLEACSRLQTLDAEGCTLTGITFPANSVLKELYLPQTLLSLSLNNQPALETIEFDGEPNITSIELLNVPVYDSYDLVYNLFSKNNENEITYALTNVNWTIECDSDITSIALLDLIKSNSLLVPKDGYSKATALTGTITLSAKNGASISANEYNIYNLYKATFPNLEIVYDSSVNLTKAATVSFMSNFQEEDDVIHYSVLTDGNQTLADLTSATGPTGMALAAPSRSATISNTYEFANYWEDKDGNYYYDSNLTTVEGGISFQGYKPTADLVLYPVFNVEVRQYTVTFYTDDKVKISQVDENGDSYDSWSVDYGSLYDGPMKNFYYKDSSSLGEEYRYTFLGWGTVYGATNPTYFDLGETAITGNLALYAYYKKESVYTPSSEEYFYLKTGDSLAQEGTLPTINNLVSINLREEYKDVLQGKITLPDTIGGKTYSMIGDFSGISLITHVFTTLTNSNILYVKESAFANSVSNVNTTLYVENPSLVRVALPDTVRRIGARAFVNQLNLESIYRIGSTDWPSELIAIGSGAFARDYNTLTHSLTIYELPETLQLLGNSAFINGGKNIYISKIPSGITTVPVNAFYRCPNARVYEFGGSANKVTSIEAYAFYYINSDADLIDFDKVPSSDSLILNKEVVKLGQSVFAGGNSSGAAEIQKAYFYYGIANYNSGYFADYTQAQFLNYIGLNGVKEIYDGEEGDMTV